MSKQRLEVNGNVVTGYIDGDRVIQFCVQNGAIITDTSACLPVHDPEGHVYLYMDCLSHAQMLLRETTEKAAKAHA